VNGIGKQPRRKKGVILDESSHFRYRPECITASTYIEALIEGGVRRKRLLMAVRCGKLTLPGETEAGNPGEEPAKGYPGATHRDDESCRTTGRAREQPSHVPLQLIGLIDRLGLKKRTIEPAATTDCSRLEKPAIVQFPLNRYNCTLRVLRALRGQPLCADSRTS